MKTTMTAAVFGVALAFAYPAHAQESQGQQVTNPVQADQQIIMQIQQKLNDQGFDAGSVDGQWGPVTQAALQNFQEQKGLEATGQLDQQTLSALGVDPMGSTGSSGGQQDGSGSSDAQPPAQPPSQ